MLGNSAFISAKTTQTWLGQFDVADQDIVVSMLRSMRLVSRDEFAESVRERLLEVSEEADGRIGLYVEREVPPKGLPPEPLFQQPVERPRRAFGPGPSPVEPDSDKPGDVGSEGLVAQLVSELCREFPERFVSHPGPERLRARKKRIRKLVLVTDLIGTGNRALRYLDAVWSVFSFKSWWSGRSSNGIAVDVVAYAATDAGRRLVGSHRLAPFVRIVAACPTLDSLADDVAFAVREACIRYNPAPRTAHALGYEGTGALIAFAHGAPNNCPRILHASTESWIPLFAKRVTAASRSTFASVLSQEDVRDRLRAMRHRRLLCGPEWSRTPQPVLETYLVLAALSHAPRTIDVVARRTGLTQLESQKILKRAFEHSWIDASNRLTEQGQAQLRAAKASRRAVPKVKSSAALYYPSSLRAPV
jgi:hypothetical protein